jgi:hypothetical protein
MLSRRDGSTFWFLVPQTILQTCNYKYRVWARFNIYKSTEFKLWKDSKIDETSVIFSSLH